MENIFCHGEYVLILEIQSQAQYSVPRFGERNSFQRGKDGFSSCHSSQSKGLICSDFCDILGSPSWKRS